VSPQTKFYRIEDRQTWRTVPRKVFADYTDMKFVPCSVVGKSLLNFSPSIFRYTLYNSAVIISGVCRFINSFISEYTKLCNFINSFIVSKQSVDKKNQILQIKPLFTSRFLLEPLSTNERCYNYKIYL